MHREGESQKQNKNKNIRHEKTVDQSRTDGVTGYFMSLPLSAAQRRQKPSIYTSRARFSFTLLLSRLQLSPAISPLFLSFPHLFMFPLSPSRSPLFPSLLFYLSPLPSQLIGAYALMNADRLRPDTMCTPIIMLLYLWLVIVRV